MKNKIKLSIIIPYYKTYELTYKLLQELLIQKTDEVEIILIDDGCQEYRWNEFEGICIIHQKNIGVAKTRNKGIKIADGEYIAFIDCDDMVTNDYIERLLAAIEQYNTDIINFNWADYNDNIIVRKPDNFAPWKAIYRKRKIPKFLEDKEYGSEDIWFQAEIESGIEKGIYSITYLDRVLYIYNSNREGSLTWKKNHMEEENNE